MKGGHELCPNRLQSVSYSWRNQNRSPREKTGEPL